ncbi:hypothetical protein F5148DRAFT_1320894 [Russula earlei]|uniref:Uncharacterized protein n=1 Tax=Russula earlei TaxID=71964 RepID=A0ACC0UIQ6_9AGAM|nr:hypothetical protein F5148DRAFT_1320894 [Russula earlei]
MASWLLNKHLQWYINKEEQHYIIRLLLMVPIYALISLALYLFWVWDITTPLLLICDAYQAILTSHNAPSSPHTTSTIAQEDQGLRPEPSNTAPPKDQTPPPQHHHRRSCQHKHYAAPHVTASWPLEH